MANWIRELKFMAQQPYSLTALALLLVLSSASLALGYAEVKRQEDSIARMQVMDQVERASIAETLSDYGSAAYYNFYPTWNAPSELAFTALGQRDVAPYMLRVRALAIEGQIYETDSLNPELGLSGRFDYEFVVAFLVPLFVVFLLHDMIATERESGRLPQLIAAAGSAGRLWVPRAGLRIVSVMLMALLPFWVLSAIGSVGPSSILTISLIVAGQIAVWSLLTLWLARSERSSSAIAAMLVTVWLGLSLLVPLLSKAAIDRAVPSVEGADISLVQREAVNDAWDLPKSATMEPFYAAYPDLADSPPITEPFHWKWYYAFQHVGDLTASELSDAYRESIKARDRASGFVALVSPAVAVQRAMQRAAGTDVVRALEYEQQVRDYHARIREFYYPYLFRDKPYDPAVVAQVPEFDVTDTGGKVDENT